MYKHSHLLLLCGFLMPALVCAQSVDEARLNENVERHLSEDQPFTSWAQDPELLKTDSSDRIEVQQVTTQEMETVKLRNVIAPIQFESGKANIPPGAVEKLRSVLDSMKERTNVRLHFIGHADDQRLSESLVRTYGDNTGLSRERAGEVAELFKDALGLPAEAVSYEWAGDAQPIASNATPEGRTRNRRVEVEVWYDVPGQGVKDQEVVVTQDTKRVKVCRIETVCKFSFQEGRARRTRVKNLVAPLHYQDENFSVTPEFTKQVQQTLSNLRDKGNVQVRFIGFTDNAPLSTRDQRIYANHLALSKARAHRVALVIQDALKLPNTAIMSDGRGTEVPVGSNDTAQGRALNRRVEVEFWHDDPLQEAPDEPQMCSAANSSDIVTKVYEPAWGSFPPLQLENGQAIIPADYTDKLRRAMADISDRTNVRLRFVGYTRNERLDRRTALVYGDDIGLSTARARRAMETIKGQMGLADARVEHEGHGYVQSADVVNEGFTQGDSSYVVVQVVYDELAVIDDYDGMDIKRLNRELRAKNPFGLNLMRISVDGKPIDDPERSSEDMQRCTDVALDRADIQFHFDDLTSSVRLSVTASSNTIPMQELDAVADDSAPLDEQEQQSRQARFAGAPVRFQMYANYSHFIDHAEVRIFDAGQSLQAKPLDVVSVDSTGIAEWQPTADHIAAPARELKYLVRAYDKQGHFDETAAQPLWMIFKDSTAENEAMDAAVDNAEPDTAAQTDDASDAQTAAPRQDPALFGNYGDSQLAVQNIPFSTNGTGAIKVSGSGIPANHTVWVAGHLVPVDASGKFVAEEILPAGAHTVEVAVLDESGSGSMYLRDLELKRNDWFYVGIADLTWSDHRINGPAKLLQGENPQYDIDSTLDGRMAFFTSGKFWDDWKLTASADTREGPVNELFSNFMNKSPEALFRRIDSDYYYPTFGDDSVVDEMAPTSGKFYLKLSEKDKHALWGNFNVDYMANELAQVDRGLYGGNLHYGSEATTRFGEKRLQVDGFAAEPGTLASREEFRGTGGSLYFVRRQDILAGSERLRIELRDKDSHIVTGVVNLRPGIDYDIDYLQGRVLLAEPLNSTVDDKLLIRSSGQSGDEAYLVVRYEYTPGFDQLDALATGGQGQYWVSDYLKLGLTSNINQDGDTDSSVNAADVTLRKSTDSWLKVQAARSEGLVSSSSYSNDGGFGFTTDDGLSFSGAAANAYRADASVGLADFFTKAKGNLSVYTQNQDAGYSAPGMETLTDTEHYGGKFSIPVTDALSVSAKADSRIQQAGLETQARELDVGYEFTDHWSVSTGVRNDMRKDHSLVVPITQEQGERTDAVVQVGYDSKAAWQTYGFVQDTISTTGDREENGRIGAGGAYRFTERFRVDGEASGGDLGPGARLGTSYLYSDRTNLYLNYALENERADNGLQMRRGNLISGVKHRLTDSSSVYLEERYQDTDFLTGLTHATGVTFKVRERWSFGANTDIGTLKDSQSGADTKRRAGGVHVGYGFEAVQISSGVEYRLDDTELPDASNSKRTTWLFRNNFRYLLTPDWRMLGKLNHAVSHSTLGDFYDGGYTEAVIGYGYRPVRNDRLNMLAKYTYFYNVPTTEQVTLQNTAAEYIQKSHIAAVDATYDLTASWSIGGKYAYRLGQLSLDRENPQFFDNRAQLYVLRADWRFRRNWEGVIEGRVLDMLDLSEKRSGALLALYRSLGEHVKLGAGYNFTDFSDDLQDLSFDHHGVFINIVGTL